MATMRPNRGMFSPAILVRVAAPVPSLMMSPDGGRDRSQSWAKWPSNKSEPTAGCRRICALLDLIQRAGLA